VYFCVYFLYLAWRLSESVVTLAVTRNTNSFRVYRRQRVPVFQRHRLPLSAKRWDIRWAIGRRTKPTLFVFFSVFPVLSVAVMSQCFDASGDGKYYFRSGFSASEGASVPEASIAVDRSRWERRWLIGRGTKPTFCVFPVFSVAVMEKCCDACGDWEY
jgi:nitrate reductase NapE component